MLVNSPSSPAPLPAWLQLDGGPFVQLNLEGGSSLQARLLVGADGRGSRVRQWAQVGVFLCSCLQPWLLATLASWHVPAAASEQLADNKARHALTHADPHDRAGLRAAGRCGHPSYFVAQPDRLPAIPAHRPGGTAARARRLQQPGLVVPSRSECTLVTVSLCRPKGYVGEWQLLGRAWGMLEQDYQAQTEPASCEPMWCCPFQTRPKSPTCLPCILPTCPQMAARLEALPRPSLLPNPYDVLPHAFQPSKCTLPCPQMAARLEALPTVALALLNTFQLFRLPACLTSPCPQMAARLEALPRHELAAAVTEALTGPPHYPPKPPLGSLLSGIMAPARTTRFVEPPQARGCVLSIAWFGCCLPAHWYGRLLAAEGCWPHLRTWAASNPK